MNEDWPLVLFVSALVFIVIGLLAIIIHPVATGILVAGWILAIVIFLRK